MTGATRIIHEFLHNSLPGSTLTFRRGQVNAKVEIIRASDGRWYASFNGMTFTKQDPNVNSLHGALARRGNKITWVKGNMQNFKIFNDKIIPCKSPTSRLRDLV